MKPTSTQIKGVKSEQSDFNDTLKEHLFLPRFITVAPNMSIWIEGIREVKIITVKGKSVIEVMLVSRKPNYSLMIDESYARKFLELYGIFFFEQTAIDEALKELP